MTVLRHLDAYAEMAHIRPGKEPFPMTPVQYKNGLKKLGLSIVGAAPYFGISRRQAQRIAADGPVPKLIATVMSLLLNGKIQKEDLI